MIIVNFSDGPYKRGQQRLKQSLTGYKCLMLDSYTAIGSPTHQQSPYEFKYWAIQSAFQYDDVVMWLDSSVWRVGDLTKLQDLILNQGYWLEEAGHWVGSWCNQHTREYFNLTEEEGKAPGGFRMFSAGYIGFHKHSPIAQDFLSQWLASARAGCFKGSHSNHRHDQTAGSIIAQRMGLNYSRGGLNVSYIGSGYSSPEPTSVLYLQGLI